MSGEIIVVNYSNSYRRDIEDILAEYKIILGRTLSRDEIRQIISDAVDKQPDGFFVAICGRDVVGFSIAYYYDLFRVAYIEHLQVKREWIGMDVDVKLIERSLEWARKKGARIIYAKVADIDKNSIELYEKSGFRITGYIPGYFKKDVDALIFARGI